MNNQHMMRMQKMVDFHNMNVYNTFTFFNIHYMKELQHMVDFNNMKCVQHFHFFVHYMKEM